MRRRPQTAWLAAVLAGLLVSWLVATAPAARAAENGRVAQNGRAAERARTAGYARERPTPAFTPDAAVLARTAPQAVRAGTTDEQCTGWRSTMMPPATVRVLRSAGPPAVQGTVQQVPLRDYVGTVIAAEWPSHYPIEVLKAGAIAVKQYAWYYTIVYRGGRTPTGECYDVVDTTTDQLYRPERDKPRAKHLAAIRATWTMSLRKFKASAGSSRFILTGYRAGSDGPCGLGADRWHMFQRSMRRCGEDGMTMEQILRRYLAPRLEIVDPGHHDIAGRRFGDTAALIADGKGTLTAHVWRSRESKQRTAPLLGPSIAVGGIRGQASVDLNADGRDDLLLLKVSNAGAVSLQVALATGASYREPRDWFRGDLGSGALPVRLLVGDFTGGPPARADGKPDAAVLLAGAKDGSARLLVFPRKTRGPGFESPLVWWRGRLNIETAGTWAADVNGDSRSDLLVAEPLGAKGSGIRYSVAPSPQLGGPLRDLKSLYEAADLSFDSVLHVPGDANRDGRDDLWLLVGNGTAMRAELLRSQGSRPFLRIPDVWAASSPMRIRKLKVAAADVDYNGFGDIVLYQNLATRDAQDAGTRRLSLAANYARLTRESAMVDTTIQWSQTRPY
jgi:hypothetical protein